MYRIEAAKRELLYLARQVVVVSCKVRIRVYAMFSAKVCTVNGEDRHADIDVGVFVVHHGEIAVIEVDCRIGDELHRHISVAQAELAQKSHHFQLRLAAGHVLVEEITTLMGRMGSFEHERITEQDEIGLVVYGMLEHFPKPVE